MKKKQIIVFAFLSALSFSSQAAAQLSVFEDFLYWHASQEPTSSWAHQITLVPTDDINDSIAQGTYFTESNVHFRWSPGVRLGIQYKPDHFIDAKLYWTHFSTKTNDSITTTQNHWILPEFFNGFSTIHVYNAAQIDWHLNMNMIDAKMGHPFHPLDALTIHPSVGIKGGTINQSIHSAWKMTLLDIQLYNSTENVNNHFSGLGPSLSLDSQWHLYKGISIRSDLETAWLWGRWNVSDIYFSPTSILGPQKNIKSETHNSLGSFMSSYFLGFEWTFQAKAQVTLKVGYEMQFWSNQLRLPVFQALPVHGDLTLQGGTCGIYINL